MLDHARSIRHKREDSTHKRNRPFGILPKQIARLELRMEHFAAIATDEQVIERAQRHLARLQCEEDHLCIQYGVEHAITRSAYAERRMAIRQSRIRTQEKLQARARTLREQVLPELRQLCAQADRAA